MDNGQGWLRGVPSTGFTAPLSNFFFFTTAKSLLEHKIDDFFAFARGGSNIKIGTGCQVDVLKAASQEMPVLLDAPQLRKRLVSPPSKQTTPNRL